MKLNKLMRVHLRTYKVQCYACVTFHVYAYKVADKNYDRGIFETALLFSFPLARELDTPFINFRNTPYQGV